MGKGGSTSPSHSPADDPEPSSAAWPITSATATATTRTCPRSKCRDQAGGEPYCNRETGRSSVQRPDNGATVQWRRSGCQKTGRVPGSPSVSARSVEFASVTTSHLPRPGRLGEYVVKFSSQKHVRRPGCVCQGSVRLSAHDTAGPVRVRIYSVLSEVTHSSRMTGRRDPRRGPARGPSDRIFPAP
jgi:hypothetical protein